MSTADDMPATESIGQLLARLRAERGLDPVKVAQELRCVPMVLRVDYPCALRSDAVGAGDGAEHGQVDDPGQVLSVLGERQGVPRHASLRPGSTRSAFPEGLVDPLPGRLSCHDATSIVAGRDRSCGEDSARGSGPIRGQASWTTLFHHGEDERTGSSASFIDNSTEDR